jgi:hypothetical protein
MIVDGSEAALASGTFAAGGIAEIVQMGDYGLSAPLTLTLP